jgi:hypothetical protein
MGKRWIPYAVLHDHSWGLQVLIIWGAMSWSNFVTEGMFSQICVHIMKFCHVECHDVISEDAFTKKRNWVHSRNKIRLSININSGYREIYFKKLGYTHRNFQWLVSWWWQMVTVKELEAPYWSCTGTYMCASTWKSACSFLVPLAEKIIELSLSGSSATYCTYMAPFSSS